MSDNQRISQLLDEQNQPKQVVDPFSQARQVYEQQNGQQPALQNSMLDFPQFQQSQQPAQPSMDKSLFPQNQPAQTNDFGSSQLPQAMQKLGLDSKGISFNQLGRIQLMGRLQKRFGANLQSQPEAMQILNQFDEHMKNSTQTDTKSSDKATANGKRTLAAIFGG